MFQVYFLSVLTNILVGIFLIFENKFSNNMLFASKKKVITVVLGLSSFVIGIIKLFVVAQPDIVIIGDLFPAITGICGGLSLLINYFMVYGKKEVELKPVVQKIFVDWKKVLGFFVLIVGILHFFIPQVRVF